MESWILNIIIQLNDGEDKLGTAILVSKNTIITCLHNIQEPEDIMTTKTVNMDKISISMENGDIGICKVIDKSSELDLAILELDTNIEDRKYGKLASICLYDPQLGGPNQMQLRLRGYLGADLTDIQTFWGYINKIRQNQIWDIDLGFNQNIELALSLGGLSGGPCLLDEMIVGIVTQQVNSAIGVPAGVVSLYKARKFLSNNNIEYREYSSEDKIYEEKNRDKMVECARAEIKEMLFENVEVEKIIKQGAYYIIDRLHDMDINDFINFIKSIQNYYKEEEIWSIGIGNFKKVIIHIVLIYYTYEKENVNIVGNELANIKIKELKRIRYLYALDDEDIEVVAMKFYEYMCNNPSISNNGLSDIIVGNDRISGRISCRERKCLGYKIESKDIIANITNTWEEDDVRITEIKETLDDVVFHCRNCFNFRGTKEDIKSSMKAILGGA